MKDRTTLRQWLGKFFRRTQEPVQPIQQHYVQPETTLGMPVAAGRQTVPNELGSNIYDMSTIKPDVPFEYLGLLQKLASVNPDISYAVENIVQLGSTNYTIDFGDSVTDAQAKVMRDTLTQTQNKWYKNLNNKAILVSNMLDQLVINGALSVEAIIENDLSGIKSIVLPNPKNIEFMYDEEEGTWQPYQRVNNGFLKGGKLGDLIKLNTTTYKYYALRNRGEKPYGIPPFLAALEMTDTEIDVLKNFKKVSKNIGIMGFLQILVNRPSRAKSTNGEYMETESEYNSRCLEYLNTMVRPEAEKGFTTGVMTGFKQDFELEFQSNNSTNISGAEKFIEILTIQKHAGLKQDPILLGRPFNTSEALGRVILDKFASQVASFQGIVACALAELFKLELVLKGFPAPNITVIFEHPNVKDEKLVEDAYATKIDNMEKLYQQGIISQTQRANELGYETPFQLEPRVIDIDDTAIQQDNQLLIDLGAEYPQYDYDELSEACCTTHSYANGDDPNDNLDKFIVGYLGSMTKAYDTYVKKVSASIMERFVSMRKNSTKRQVFDAVYNTILRTWVTEFKPHQKPIINKWLDAAYKSFRADKNVFGKIKVKDKDGNVTNIPAPTLDLIDARTVSYMKRSDELYMGKFITDKDTKNRLQDFIYAEFEKGDIPLGQTAGQKAFIEKMAATLNIEKYKIERIVKTTTNKLRSYAAINYLHQANIQSFEILALIDNRTSDICRKMNGKTFSVAASRARVIKVSKSLTSSTPQVTPFVSSVFKSNELDLLDDLTGDDLLSDYAIFAPPFHGNCRTQVVAVG